MNLSDIAARYSVPADTVKVTLPMGEEIEFRRIGSAVEMADVRAEAEEWAKGARAMAIHDDVARKALGELAGDRGLEYIQRACIMAHAVVGSDLPVIERRYNFCKLAAFAGPVFEIMWMNGIVGGMVTEAMLQMGDAQEGKAGCGQTPPCSSDCESPETCGASTPTN